jgi:beta-glucosidase
MTTSPTPATRPSRFRWGASTAAFQIEGAAHLDGRTDSIWDPFCRVPGAILDDHDGEVACDHYFRYAQDVGLMRALNLGAYRFSTSWSRVRPSGGAADRRGLDFYSRLVDELLTHDIEPWVTLYHWDLPQTIEERGGWADRETVHRFVDYALTVHDELGDRVNVWTTVNEPWCAAFLGYGSGQHAPGRSERRAALAAAHHLLLAHGMAATELRSRSRDATIAISLNLEVVDPADPDDPDDVEAARRVDGQLNRIFLDPLFRGTYPDDVLADTAHLGLADHIRDRDLQTIRTPIDLLGVNYFHGRAVSRRRPAVPSHTHPQLPRQTDNPLPAADDIFDVPRNLPTTAVGWEIQPEGLTRLLLRLQAEYTGRARVGLAVESGAAFEDAITPEGRVDDPRRREYLERHIRATQVAMAKGADVRAYFVRSLLDDFEWAWGYSKRYGLVHVDFATQERVVKSSGEWYAKVAAGMPLPPASEETTR